VGDERCVEHGLRQPCAKCALLCPCGCDELRDGVTGSMWTDVVIRGFPIGGEQLCLHGSALGRCAWGCGRAAG
jgi:hypothetical protein